MQIAPFYKKAESIVANMHYGATTHIKSIKRFFMGDGLMMSIYKMIRTHYETGDTQGLVQLKQTLEAEMPPYHSAHYTKQVELVLYIDYLVKLPKMPYKMMTHKRYELIKNIDTSHEIGRKILLTL